MTVRKRNAYPIESFGPELMAALLEGARKQVDLKLNFRDANFFRARINHLRKRMREMDHPEFPLAAKARIQILWGLDAGMPQVEEVISSRRVRRPKDDSAPCILRLSPQDQQFAKVLKEAGVEAGVLHNDPLAALPVAELPHSPSSATPGEDVLKQYEPKGD